MNRRTFLQSIAAIPLVGPAAAMAAKSSPATFACAGPISISAGSASRGWIAVIENVGDLLDLPKVIEMRPTQWFMHCGDGHFYCGTKEFHPLKGLCRVAIPNGSKLYEIADDGTPGLVYESYYR